MDDRAGIDQELVLGGISLREGDEMEIQADDFGRPLRNLLEIQKPAEIRITSL
jgi:hypothetical protein